MPEVVRIKRTGAGTAAALIEKRNRKSAPQSEKREVAFAAHDTPIVVTLESPASTDVKSEIVSTPFPKGNVPSIDDPTIPSSISEAVEEPVASTPQVVQPVPEAPVVSPVIPTPEAAVAPKKPHRVQLIIADESSITDASGTHFPSAMGTYKWIRDVGKGAFGKASLVVDKDGQELVLKTIELGKMKRSDKELAANEMKLIKALGEHPFVVRYEKMYAEGTKLYILMEFCDSGDLSTLIADRKAAGADLSETEILRLLTQLMLGVQFLHKAHILHRDLKTQNVFLGAGQVKIGDFGVSKILASTAAQAQTQIGTPYYLSPELCQGHAYGYAADVWAIGVIGFEMCNQRLPFLGKTISELTKTICGAAVPNWTRACSAELRDLCLSMLNRDPAKRPTLQQALDSALLKPVADELRTEFHLK